MGGGRGIASYLDEHAAGLRLLGQILRHQVGLASTTERNHSAQILRRLGGSRLRHQGVELPPFFDPAYDCDMELLTFDPDKPSAEFADTVIDLKKFLVSALVVCNPSPQESAPF